MKLAGDCLCRHDAQGLARNLRLIWDWHPEFEPPQGFLLDQIGAGKVNDRLIATLEKGLAAMPHPRARGAIEKLIASFWCGQGRAELNEQINWANRRQLEFLARVAVSPPLEKLRTLQLIKTDIRGTLAKMRAAQTKIEKAARTVPGDTDFREAQKWANDQIRAVEQVLRQLESIG